MRRIGKSLLSLTLAFSMVFSALMLPDIMHINDTKEASATTVSSVMGTDDYTDGATLTEGTTYTFGGYNWVCAETSGNLAVLQSTGVTGGSWPGFAMSGTLTNAAGSTITLTGRDTEYTGNIDGYDISNYNSTTQSLYNSIKAAEYTSATYGKGLYLVSNSKAGITTSGSNQSSGYYWEALKSAAASSSSLGAEGFAWTGTHYTHYGSNNAYFVGSDGGVYGDRGQYSSFVLAPAFNLDTSKVKLSETTITIFQDPTGIEATQSITSVEEGATTDLASIITAVKYVGGSNAGKSASYTVSCDRGSINGTAYTAPNDVKSGSEKVNFTITSTRNTSWETTVSCNLTPQAAGKIEVTKKGNYPDSITTGDQIDFADYITVTAKDAADNVDGEITTYDVTCEGLSGSGHVMTADTVTDDTTYPITITARQTLGTTSYDGKVYGDVEDEETYGKVQIKIKPSTSGYTDRDGLEDDKGFHKYEDLSTGITWNYKYDDSGNIRFLYTTDNVEKIISKGKVLLVPSSINGTAVIGIGGGRKNEDTIPFIPTSGEKANNTWTSIYIPSSIKYINDEAFVNNQAAASIAIPSTVEQIGVGAFKDSKITSLVINSGSKNNVELYESAFENCDALKDVAIRGDHTIIGHYAFKNDTAIKSLDIPYGTRFGKTSQDDSYAFAGTTGLEVVKIDTDTVYRNIFSGNKSLKKVIFGENVTNVNYDWSGTAATEGNQATLDSTVDRTTYVLNAETIFKMSKEIGGSPFGYKGNLTIVGKNHDLNNWENKYDNTNDPVIAKVAYLADNYKTNSDIKKYAQGTADSITITVEDDPSTNSGVTETIASEQTGIEASCSSVLLMTKTLNKDKITVYKMFGTTQNGKCENDEFYVFRTSVANELLNKARGNQKQEDGTSNWYATDSNEIKQEFMNADDTVTVTEEDLESGTLDLTVVMLKCDANGNIYVNHNTANNVQAFTYALAVPVKAYTAEDDFLENYGSYEAVITTIDSLKTDINNLKSQITSKDEEITAKDEELAELKATLAKYTDMYNKLVTQMKQLNESMGVKDDGYFADKKTDNGTVKVVYINGKELTYEPAGTTDDGHKLYESTGDIDGDGVNEDIVYWVDENGVHIIQKNGEELSEEIVYKDDIAALQRRITAQLIAMQADLTAMNTRLKEVETALGITTDENATADERYTAILDKIDKLKQDMSQLTEENEKLQTEYDEIIKTVYGSKPDKDVTADEIAARIESDKQDAINEAVQNALKDNNEVSAAIDANQKAIAAIIKDILATGDIKDNSFSAELASALEDVKAMRSQLKAMEDSGDATGTALNSIRTALGLEDTADTAAILASIQSLNSQVEELTKENAKLLAENNQLKAGSSNSGNSNISASDIANVEMRGYNKGYNAGYTAGSSSNSEVTTLNKQIDTLKAENKDLTTQVNTLSAGIDELYNAIPSNGLLGASPIDDTVKKLSAVKVTLSSMESLNKQNTKLTKKVASLDKTNKKLTKSNKSLKKTNKKLTNSNNSLKKTNSSLKSENATLTATNNTLRSELQDATSNTASVSNNSNTTKGSAIVDKKEENVAVKPTETETESESTEETEENVPTLSDKVSSTKPIYETPEIEQDTESGNDEVSGLPSVPGDTESTEPLPDELNDSDSSLPIGPIVFVVIVVVGVVVIILKRNKKAKADIDDV